ncbi:MAG: YifB family Mg chelatase-like AAA ATPase [Deltaproteobacteria bacterium]|nr:YifB family Mg chelatase-like AAA ATPase [Deltaproteobacteria bacterium]
MISSIKSAGLLGINAYPLDVEVDISLQSLPQWHTVGLPESAVKESRERVVSAIKNSGYDFAQRKVTINLAPADIKKEGTAFDLPIALGLLNASGVVQSEKAQSYLYVGELSLNGDLRPIRGVLPIAMLAARKKYAGIILPEVNAGEAAMVEELPVFSMKHLSEVVEFVEGRLPLDPVENRPFGGNGSGANARVDFDEISGQYQAKRALEVAASAGHNILFVGPPGAGKTMLASRLPTILPSLTFQESLETSQIYSVMNLLRHQNQLLTERPFRAPHHSVSDAGLIGGGTIPRPGEVSLANNGVLFLDEMPEFKKNVLELLRQPLESGEVTITRASMSLTYPADFMLVAAMNPCPCGFYGHPRKACVCTPHLTQKYRTKLSGPLLDRIDLQIEVPPVPFDEMTSTREARESSEAIRKRVIKTRAIQCERFKKEGVRLNSQMTPRMMRKYCGLGAEGKQLLKGIMEKFHLSARAFDRILKVSRTLADMEESESIETRHLLEAVQYRSLDRNLV